MLAVTGRLDSLRKPGSRSGLSIVGDEPKRACDNPWGRALPEMASGQKKVIIRRFNDQIHWGYLPQEVALLHGYVELIDPAAHVTPILLTEIKWIAYVRDFNLADRHLPERLDRKRFAARPRTEGLWVRMRLTDGETLEGLVQVNRTLLDSLADSTGIFVTPPDTRGNTQRLFVPRSAIESIEAVGLIQPAAVKAAKPAKEEPQPSLFEE